MRSSLARSERVKRALPQLLGLVGLNAAAISKNLSAAHPMLAGALAGGRYPSLTVGLDVVSGFPVPAFAAWEMFAASAIYWYIVPCIQFTIAVIFVDTWQYFLHRAMHMNKWLYSKSSLGFSLCIRSNIVSNLPCSTPPPLRPLRLRSALQSPIRRFSPRYTWSRNCI